MLVALGFDRREAVVYPLQFARHRYRGAYLVSGAWLLSALLSSPILFLMQVVEVDSIRQCNIILPKFGWKIYVVYMLTFVIIIPSILLISFYSQIVSTINRKYQQAAIMERRLERDLKNHKNFQDESENNNNCNLKPAIKSSATTNNKIHINHEPISTTTITTIDDVESSSADDDDDDEDELDDDNHSNNSNDRRKTIQCNIIRSLCSGKSRAKNNSVDITITLSGNGNSWNNKIYSNNDNTNVTATTSSTNRHHQHPSSIKQFNEPNAKLDNDLIKSQSQNKLSHVNSVAVDCQQQSTSKSQVNSRPRRLTGALINRQHGKSIIPKARLKTIQMTIAIVIAFLICWLPFYVVNIISVFNLIDQKNEYWDRLMSYTNIFCYLNSAMNPVLYFWFSHNGNKKPKTKSQKTIKK